MKEIHYSVLGVMLLVLSISLVEAVPVPRGVSGTAYDTDGTTEIKAEISLNNTANGFYIAGMTGQGSNGHYAASIKGNNGDLIIIEAVAGTKTAERNVTLEGVMHNVNLVLVESQQSETSGGSGSSELQGGSGSEIFVSQVQFNESALDYEAIREKAEEVIGHGAYKRKIKDIIISTLEILEGDSDESVDDDSGSDEMQNSEDLSGDSRLTSTLTGYIISGLDKESVRKDYAVVFAILLGVLSIMLISVYLHKIEK